MKAIATVVTAEAVQLACQEAGLEARAAARDFFEKHGSRSAELHAELTDAKALLEKQYARWEELEKIKAATESQ